MCLLRKWPCERKRRSLGSPVLVAGLNLPIFSQTPYIYILPNFLENLKTFSRFWLQRDAQLKTSSPHIGKRFGWSDESVIGWFGWSDERENAQLRPSSFAVWSELFHPIRLWRMCLSSLWTDDDQSGGPGDYHFQFLQFSPWYIKSDSGLMYGKIYSSKKWSPLSRWRTLQ